jgi:tryptophan synthase beta chain
VIGARGRFGSYGGAYVPETVVPALEQLEAAMDEAFADPGFVAELRRLLHDFAGRPTPLTRAPALSAAAGGAQIWLKREDLLHTGAHKINNALGQVMLAQRMGKRRIIAETGAGQHGVATATACARSGLGCTVYMGREDMRRQAINVYRMQLLGATVVPVDSGAGTLKDATNEAIRDWVANVRDTHYVIGSSVGPHPYPTLVRALQRVIGDETRAECLARWGSLPAAVVACVGGGSNAIGIFAAFLDDAEVELVGVEAAGRGLDGGEHAAPLNRGRPGVLHGSHSYLMQDENGQVLTAHSISAGLDYPGVGPEHSALRDSGRVRYVCADDEQALAAFHRLCRLEGIIPALESSHALHAAEQLAAAAAPHAAVVVCLSGRGDKDIATVREHDGDRDDGAG